MSDTAQVSPEFKANERALEVYDAIQGKSIVFSIDAIGDQIIAAIEEERAECADLAEAVERSHWEHVGNPMIPKFDPRIANGIRARGERPQTTKHPPA